VAPVNAKLVLLLSTLGLLVGVLSVLGLTSKSFLAVPLEFWLWITTAAVTALVLARRVGAAFFRHGFAAGALAGLWPALLMFLFFDAYMANNPVYAEEFSAGPGGLSPRVFFLISAPLRALAWGAVVGSLTWLASRGLRSA
jgi:hypothetical protein